MAISADADAAMVVIAAAVEEEVALTVVIEVGAAAASEVIEAAAFVVTEAAAFVATAVEAFAVIAAEAFVEIAAEAFVVDGVDSKVQRFLGKLRNGDFECCTDNVSAMAATYRSLMLRLQRMRMQGSNPTYLKLWQ